MSRKRRKKPVLEGIRIEAVAAGGKSLARIDGKVLFVPLTIPGDVVDVQVTRVRSGYMEGYVLRFVEPSPDRTEPFCDHFGTCGGCSWQPLPYPLQLRFKQQQVVDQLSRIGHLELPEISPILGSVETVRYRNKMEYTFSRRRWILDGEDPEALTDEERCGLGFHVGGFFDKVLDIRECHLQQEPSNAIRLFAKAYALEHGLSFYDLRGHEGFLRNLTIRIATTGEIMVLVAFGKENALPGEEAGEAASRAGHDRNAFLEALSERFPEITSLYYVVNPKCNDAIGDLPCTLFRGAEAIYEKMESLRFKIGPKSFYQTNSPQALRLYGVVRDFVQSGISSSGDGPAKENDASGPVIYDLYTGTGTIALFLARFARRVVGIEYVPEAIEDARINARINGIGNTVFYAGDMKDILTPGFIAENGRPDIVVLDPPRAGIHPDVARVLLETAPEKMVYVSCNPATQARDLALFSPRYRITAVQPVDMFPHTTHVENVVCLVRKEDGTAFSG